MSRNRSRNRQLQATMEPRPTLAQAREQFFNGNWLADYRENPDNERQKQIQEGKARMRKESGGG